MLAISRFLLSNFIDGTVEGTDIHTGISGVDYVYLDRTYYGNGCDKMEADKWEYSCSTRIAQTSDGESQKNGTSYTFLAISAGSSDVQAPADTNALDTFCPLGWQLPYGGTGGDYYDKSKSWIYLLNSYGGFQNTEEDLKKIKSYPMSYILSGQYYFNGAFIFGLNSETQFWTMTQKTTQAGIYYLAVSWHSATYVNKGNGRAARCVDFFTSLHRRHGGRNT